jgi:hypothetical protein
LARVYAHIETGIRQLAPTGVSLKLALAPLPVVRHCLQVGQVRQLLPQLADPLLAALEALVDRLHRKE